MSKRLQSSSPIADYRAIVGKYDFTLTRDTVSHEPSVNSLLRKMIVYYGQASLESRCSSLVRAADLCVKFVGAIPVCSSMLKVIYLFSYLFI